MDLSRDLHRPLHLTTLLNNSIKNRSLKLTPLRDPVFQVLIYFFEIHLRLTGEINLGVSLDWVRCSSLSVKYWVVIDWMFLLVVVLVGALRNYTWWDNWSARGGSTNMEVNQILIWTPFHHISSLCSDLLDVSTNQIENILDTFLYIPRHTI